LPGKKKSQAIREYADKLAVKTLDRLDRMLEDAGTGNADVFKAASLLLERHLKGSAEVSDASADFTIRAEE
jgi:hypothetical protein